MTKKNSAEAECQKKRGKSLQKKNRFKRKSKVPGKRAKKNPLKEATGRKKKSPKNQNLKRL